MSNNDNSKSNYIDQLFKDTQDITDIDVKSIKTTLNSIDTYRNKFRTSQIQLDGTITEDKFDNFLSTNTPSNNYQESRAHCFYRMIGFPIYNKDYSSFFNPGIDPDGNALKDARDSKIKVCANIDQSLLKKSVIREEYSVNKLKYFENQSFEGSALLMSIPFVRSFDTQISNIQQLFGADDYPTNYLIDYFNNRGVELKLFDSEFKNTQHYIKPIFIDPRIEYTSSRNRMSVPFQLSKNLTSISLGKNKIELPRPYLESVIRIAFNNSNNSNQSEYITQIQSYIQKNSLQNPELLGNITKSLNPISDVVKSIFFRYIKLIKATINKLHILVSNTKKLTSQVNWCPLPNQLGAENIATTRDIYYADANNLTIEKNILEAKALEINNQNVNIFGVSTTDINNNLFNNINDIIFSQINTINDNVAKKGEKLTQQRKEPCDKINQNIASIEMIVGKFSGFGFIDVLAFQAALWSLDNIYLAGLLDEGAWGRLKENSELDNSVNRQSLKPSLDAFESQLSLIYRIIQSFWDQKTGKSKA